MSYHLRPIIPQGIFGQVSKVLEEIDEYVESTEQGNKIMAAVELSDIYGALEAVAATHGLQMSDLAIMAQATKRAFETGERKPKCSTTDL